MDALSEVLAAGQVGRPVSARTVGRTPWALRMIFPGAAVFHVAMQGSAWLTVDGHAPLRLDPGDVALLPHGSTHTLGDDPATPPVELGSLADAHPPGQAIASAEFGGDGARSTLLCGAYLLTQAAPQHPMLGSLPAVMHLPASRGADPQLRALVDLLASEVERPGPGSTTIVSSLVDAMFAYLLRTWCATNPGACPQWLAALADPVLGRALVAVHADPAAPWTVGQLASVAGLSRAAFARRFAEQVGLPPLTYLTRWRMVRAQQVLRANSAPLDTVAREVGYDSAFAFSKAFKRHTGVSPARYRESVR
ncbi:AraC family transcriptional regulator [Luedemannella flava]|uniref:AraC family transcriptional regulator n=1 Tax=Luedemannella flava TaxID=349316 RepID=A0ABP4Y5A9_9ACTN